MHLGQSLATKQVFRHWSRNQRCWTCVLWTMSHRGHHLGTSCPSGTNLGSTVACNQCRNLIVQSHTCDFCQRFRANRCLSLSPFALCPVRFSWFRHAQPMLFKSPCCWEALSGFVCSLLSHAWIDHLFTARVGLRPCNEICIQPPSKLSHLWLGLQQALDSRYWTALWLPSLAFSKTQC